MTPLIPVMVFQVVNKIPLQSLARDSKILRRGVAGHDHIPYYSSVTAAPKRSRCISSTIQSDFQNFKLKKWRRADLMLSLLRPATLAINRRKASGRDNSAQKPWCLENNFHALYIDLITRVVQEGAFSTVKSNRFPLMFGHKGKHAIQDPKSHPVF